MKLLITQLEQSKDRIMRLARKPEDQEDLFQGVCVACLESFTLRDWGQSQTGWLLRVARNLRVTELRRRKVRRALSLVDERVIGKDRGPLADIEREEIREIVRSALFALSPIYRDVLHRHYFMDQTCAEIARRLRMPIESVLTRVKRALSIIRSIRAIKSLG